MIKINNYKVMIQKTAELKFKLDSKCKIFKVAPAYDATFLFFVRTEDNRNRVYHIASDGTLIHKYGSQSPES
jgi:hypothetical protein